MDKKITLRLVSPDDDVPLAPLEDANRLLQEYGLGVTSVGEEETFANEPAERDVREAANGAAAPLVDQAAEKRKASNSAAATGDELAEIAKAHAARLVEQYKNRETTKEDLKDRAAKWGMIGSIVSLTAAVLALLKELLLKS